jgi:hypothetical protein
MSTLGLPEDLPESQPAQLSNSWKYLAHDRLPRMDTTTSFREVYSQLNRSGNSGFLLSANGEVRGYVKAYELATEVVQRANGDAQALRTYSSEAIGELIAEFGVPLVPVLPADEDATESLLYQKGETVFRIKEANGRLGWYLNHEGVRETATKKTVFICSNGHRNPDSDHGTCYRCPFPIVGTDTE